MDLKRNLWWSIFFVNERSRDYLINEYKNISCLGSVFV